MFNAGAFPVGVNAIGCKRGAVPPASLGTLLYGYDSEDVVTTTSIVTAWNPLSGTAGPVLNQGEANPVAGSWGYGNQPDVRSLTTAAGLTGTGTRASALGDYTMIVVFEPITNANDSPIMSIRPGGYGSSTTTGMLGYFNRLATGALYWYARPSGTIMTGQTPAGVVPIGTRNWAAFRRAGSTLTVWLNGLQIATLGVGTTTSAAGAEVINLLNDPSLIDAAQSAAIRAAYVFTSAIDMAAFHAWVVPTFIQRIESPLYTSSVPQSQGLLEAVWDARSGVATTGGLVDSWTPDAGDPAYVLTPPTSGERPTLTTGGSDSKPIVAFGGSHRLISAALGARLSAIPDWFLVMSLIYNQTNGRKSLMLSRAADSIAAARIESFSAAQTTPRIGVDGLTSATGISYGAAAPAGRKVATVGYSTITGIGYGGFIVGAISTITPTGGRPTSDLFELAAFKGTLYGTPQIAAMWLYRGIAGSTIQLGIQAAATAMAAHFPEN